MALYGNMPTTLFDFKVRVKGQQHTEFWSTGGYMNLDPLIPFCSVTAVLCPFLQCIFSQLYIDDAFTCFYFFTCLYVICVIYLTPNIQAFIHSVDATFILILSKPFGAYSILLRGYLVYIKCKAK